MSTIQQEYTKRSYSSNQIFDQKIAEMIRKVLEENETDKNNKEVIAWISQYTNTPFWFFISKKQ